MSAMPAWLLTCAMLFSIPLYSQQSTTQSTLPVIPVGYDAYRMWDKWPQQRIGIRAYMRSTYSRAGKGSKHSPTERGYKYTDASHFLFFNEENDNVTLDVKGKGISYFFRTNHWHGSPWNFQIDGKDNIVQETGTSDPVNAKKTFTNPVFIPSEPFPKPLNWTWATTRGADLIWTPMPFEESFRISYSRTFYGTGYYIYHLFANEENLSQPIRSWDLSTTPDQDVLDLLDRAGTDIAPQRISKKSGTVSVSKNIVTLAQISDTPSVVRALKITLPLKKAGELERLRLLVTWDDAKHPSIDAPLCLFFGTGTFYNRDQKEFLVKGLPVNVRFDYANQKVELACYYPMPFFKTARFELAGTNVTGAEIDFEIRYEPYKTPKHFSSYFHATYADFPRPVPGKDLVFLDTKGIEGHSDWSGNFVGNSFIFSHNAVLGTLEGDPKFYFDDSRTPQAYGTGTEEWGGGGDYWGGENMTLPLAGHPVGARNKSQAKNEKDLIQSAYRFLLADLMPFGRRAEIHFEHSENLSLEHYESVTYWYGLPAPTLIKTDSLDVGDPGSEKKHQYHSPQASPVEKISSRWDGYGLEVFPEDMHGRKLTDQIPGYDTLVGKHVYPLSEEDGRFTHGTSEFQVALDPRNVGALLRRTLDYSIPNQTAAVYVADAKQKGNKIKWTKVGTWYLAGSTTYMYSNPREQGELSNRLLDVHHSDRRFRDDEFLIPYKLTRGRTALRVKLVNIPDTQELYPGHPFSKKSAWSELRYDVYSYVLPKSKNPR